uniref:Uncharacterized protein n=1 Tax=Glossina austeni TaxID=7395 RepID=A0A1A9UXQ2_GLOAU
MSSILRPLTTIPNALTGAYMIGGIYVFAASKIFGKTMIPLDFIDFRKQSNVIVHDTFARLIIHSKLIYFKERSSHQRHWGQVNATLCFFQRLLILRLTMAQNNRSSE